MNAPLIARDHAREKQRDTRESENRNEGLRWKLKRARREAADRQEQQSTLAQAVMDDGRTMMTMVAPL